MNCRLLCLTVLLVTARGFGTPESHPLQDSGFRHLVDFFQGQWTCAGHFANGTAIFSNEAFEPLLDGVWLQEVHHDRPPFSYHAYSLWGVDRRTRELTLTIHDSSGGLRIFASHIWNQPAITFDVSSTSGHVGDKERFVYVQHPPDSFSFEYERDTDSGQWKINDHVDCKRKH